MTREEFKAEIKQCIDYRPIGWRKGQAVYNYIDGHYNVARKVQFFDHVDCFYNDEVIDDFVELAYCHINGKDII